MTNQPNDGKKFAPVVYALNKAARCYGCDIKLETDSIVKLEQGKEEQEVLCSNCSGLKDFVLLQAGNAELTRAVKKQSPNTFVVMKWSELWKCYERKGLYVERNVLETAKEQIAKSSDKKSRK